MALVSAKLTLHTQTVEDAMIQLLRVKDPRAQAAFSLAEQCTLFPLNEDEMKHSRGKNKTKPFSEDEWEAPILYGLADAPFQMIPSLTQIQQILIMDMGGNNNRSHFAPTRGNFELDAQAASHLLHNIHVPLYSERGAIINLRSPTFESLFTKKPEWGADGLVGQSDMHMTITPAHEVLDLAYHDYFYLSTLLSGSKVWIVYPPSKENFASLTEAYEQLQGATYGSTFLKISSRLRHGIVIVQQAGQTLLLPPFWAHIVFCPETTVSGGHLITTAIKFPERLLHLELYQTVLSIWPDRVKQQCELLRYLETMAVHMRMVIGEEMQYSDHINVIKGVCGAWREQHAQFAAMCKAIEDKDDRHRVALIVITAWTNFLESRRKKKPVCRLCNVRIEHMTQKPGETPHKILMRHFMVQHFDLA